jgi:hypothetical protein
MDWPILKNSNQAICQAAYLLYYFQLNCHFFRTGCKNDNSHVFYFVASFCSAFFRPFTDALTATSPAVDGENYAINAATGQVRIDLVSQRPGRAPRSHASHSGPMALCFSEQPAARCWPWMPQAAA